MTQQTILITGAGSGIGKGIAEQLALFGHEIIATDLNLEAVEVTKNSILNKNGQVSAYQLDVTNINDIQYLLEKLANKNINILINNAGIQHVARLENFPETKWEQLIQVMLIGVARLTKAILPNMQTNNFGRIINIGSIHSLVASPYKSAYVAAKHGLLGFSKTIALENADKDITINTICPSYVKTPLVDKQISNQAKEHSMSEEEVVSNIMLKPMPKNQFISIEELTGTIDFLMSDYAKNITGQTITIDGGWTIQ